MCVDLSIGKECVHSLQEAGVQHVRLVHHKHNLLSLAPGAPQDVTKIVVKVSSRVLPVNLYTKSSIEAEITNRFEESDYGQFEMQIQTYRS